MGPILFAHNENIAHVMPRVTARAVTPCAHHAARACMQAGRPKYTWRARNYLWTCFAQAELYLPKITASHCNALNTKIANQSVLERILIAMLNENTAVSNENFRN